MRIQSPLRKSPKRQHGGSAVEFALTAILWITMTVGVIDMGRAMYTWTALHEAARVGARSAVVCGTAYSATLAAMQSVLPSVVATSTNVVINYPGTPCTAASCTPLSLRIVGVPFRPILAPINFTFPDIWVSLPIETRFDAAQPTSCAL